MIRVVRPEPALEALVNAGTQARLLLCNAYDAGQRTFTFDDAIYGADSVKETLKETQYGKCAFCERQVGLDSDVEHFRPKGAVQQAKGRAVVRPGYYWLAYEWSNLLLSCTHCNCRHKRNLFPLANPQRRVTDHNQGIDREQPLLIDPASENPEQFLDFRDEYIFAVQANQRGEETIRVLGLDREALNEERLSCLQRLRQLNEYALLLEARSDESDCVALAEKIRAEIARQCSDSEPFAMMARAAYRRAFHAFTES